MTNIESTMYTLGQLARAVYPAGDIPQPMLDTLLTRPASGVAMLAKAHEPRATRPTFDAREHDAREDFDAFMERLPADLTNGPIPIVEQGPFWTGWYHYLSALDRSRHCKPEHLERAGKLLFGDRWQSDLARALNVGDRRVREWFAGDRSIPAGIWVDIATLLRQRNAEGLALLQELDT